MEYLDPEKKRKHRQRIALGYVLIGLLISMVTLVVLLAGYGYGFDRSTGEFVQNGIMFVDTKHRPANVTLNGEPYGQTDLRLVLREGDYSLVATREGYRDWKRDVTIRGGKLRKLTYGLLVPQTLQPQQVLTLNENPTRALQSIDKDRIVAWDPVQNQTLLVFDISQDPVSVTRLSLESLVESTRATPNSDEEIAISDIEFIDFDSSDQSVLSTVIVDGKTYTWLIDTTDTTQSRNITNALPSAFRNDDIEITMIDRDPTRYYVFDKTAGEVYQAELRGDSLALITVPEIDENVLAFVGFDSDWMLFVTESIGQEGLVNVQFRQGDKTVLLKQMKTSDEYHLSLANNAGKAFMGIGASEEIAAFIYVDPVGYLNRNPSSVVPAPSTIMPMPEIMDMSVSNDASVIIAHNTNRVATFDYLSEDTHYKDLDHTLESGTELKWIDGQHYTYVVDNTIWMIDYDGSNQQQLTSASEVGIFYRDGSEGYFSFVTNPNQAEESEVQSLVFTSLVTEADQ